MRSANYIAVLSALVGFQIGVIVGGIVVLAIIRWKRSSRA